MQYGWARSNLEIDLSRGNIRVEECDDNINRNYLGGKGTSVKLIWDRVPPEVTPFSPENLLVFGVGLLSGTLAPGANRAVLATRSPVTNLLTYSFMGGYWGPELKHAGYEHLIVSGKSPHPVYIWVNNDRVEIRDARHLWGKNIKETQQAIKEELQDNKVQILCVGPAGENKVLSASIEHSTGASFSRAGVGALMGDKNIKAIAVRGTKDIHMAEPEKFYRLCMEILNKTGRLMEFVDNWSYEREGLLEKAVYGNLGEFQPLGNTGERHDAYLKENRERQISCYNCTLRCKHAMRSTQGHGSNSFIKCVSWFAFIACCKIQDFNFAIKCYELCEELGFDSLSAAYLIGFAIDLYEKGILTREDTEGMHLEWGSPEIALTMIKKIAFREGIGDVLADGVVEAARRIGRGAEKYAYNVKKMEIPIYPLHHFYLNLCQSLDDRADMLKLISALPQHYLRKTAAEKEEYLGSQYWPYPEGFKKFFEDKEDPTGGDYERLTNMISYDHDSNTMADITGVCIFWTGFWPFNPYVFANQVKLVSYATGLDIDENEGLKIAKRIGTLVRAYNVRLGISRKDDAPPERFFQEPSIPPVLPPLDRNNFNKAIDTFYELRGYDKNGIPSEQSLLNLDLGYVADDLKQRGIIPG
ncbi:MAG: aldehyde ferredoxin oxidoreductase N-terminal domain-containing protein [Thermincola sp.]|jgi:aldehyde:ferredoxin oxidoreductase|nr:aldehyde ferredoxin oxidoreductase N-terminal domain-containing protein [Thermincola sp.]MDT3704232.1 aldehyde ferredoxin oxidoreductase N-terminal domain-containing protein [Thermincola sp.]